MPELPELETTCRGLAPHVTGRRLKSVVVREPRLRWPVPADLPHLLAGSTINALRRRAKYLLFQTDRGDLMVHLGMSGSLRMVQPATPLLAHDHIDLQFEGGLWLRYNDPRRFGSFHWLQPGDSHPLLAQLGPEPLEPAFDGAHLFRLSRGRRTGVKPFVMDGRIVVGVGNIYASEALFLAGISPSRPAGRIALARYDRLAGCIRQVLAAAIEQGGTTLRDFVGGD
ncbi:MAG: bifunctional DNA-formamidopyrimidine glycosylase/DNA-(apurinic or apyrimidinic site) lyase, partial [Chromatocurvus sp.]